MKVYEFYLRDQFRSQAFDTLCDSFYRIGSHFVRVVDEGGVYSDVKKGENDIEFPHPKAGQAVIGPAVYSISKNPNTHWVQLLVDDNTPPTTTTAIEARIAALKDDNDPLRTFEDEDHHNTPMETPRHFTMEQVLEIRRKQKDGTLGPIE